jgi:hypothetical protein
MARSSITRTLGPIHFEDLDPRRFEDLVRELAYDFKDWQSIEATGRGGNDDGFDIRAYERFYSVSNGNESEEHDVDEETAHALEGHVWMFQCKREEQIGPRRIPGTAYLSRTSRSALLGAVSVIPQITWWRD